MNVEMNVVYSKPRVTMTLWRFPWFQIAMARSLCPFTARNHQTHNYPVARSPEGMALEEAHHAKAAARASVYRYCN